MSSNPTYFLPRKRHREISSINSTSIEYISKSGKYFYSLFSQSRCAICQDQIENPVQCPKCFRNFHKKCIDNNEMSECKFCFFSVNSVCCHCEDKIFEKEHITIQCELCDNILHYQCTDMNLFSLLSRDLYEGLFKDTIEGRFFYNELLTGTKAQSCNDELKASLNQKYYLTENVIKPATLKSNFKNKALIPGSTLQLFYICNFCKKKKAIRTEIQKVHSFTCYSKILYSSFKANLHDILIPSFISENKNQLASVSGKSIPLDKLKFKKIIHFLFYNDNSIHFKYALCKWGIYEYSIEHCVFLSYLKQFQNVKKKSEAYIEKKEKNIHKAQISHSEVINIIREFSIRNASQSDGLNDQSLLHNLYIINEEETINVKRRGLFFDFFTYLYSQKYDDERFPKLMIIVNKEDRIKLWKDKLNSISPKIIVKTLINSHKPLLKILYELIQFYKSNNFYCSYYDKIQKIIAKYPNIHKENNINALIDIVDFFRSIKIKDHQLIPDVLIVPLDVINIIQIRRILLFFKINLFLFDIDTDIKSQEYLSETITDIQKGANPNFDSIIYSLISTKTYTLQPLNDFISPMFINPKSDTLIINSFFKTSIFTAESTILNQNIKLIHTVADKFIKSFLINFGWEIVYNKEILSIPNIITGLTSSNDNVMHYSSQIYPSIENFSRTIINFIPIDMKKDFYLRYTQILKEKLEVLIKASESKKDLIINTLIFCSFPNSINKYFINYLLDIGLEVRDQISEEKINVLRNLINYIENVDNAKKIIIVYSLIRGHNSFEFTNNFNYMLEKNDITFYNIDDPELFKTVDNIEEKAYVVLFNVLLLSKNSFLFIEKVNSKNKINHEKIVLFQLYTRNLIENNLCQIFYSKIKNFSKPDITNLWSLLTNEERETILIRNLQKFNDECVEINFNNYLYSYNQIETADSIAVVDKTSFLYCAGGKEMMKDSMRQFDKRQYDIEEMLNSLITKFGGRDIIMRNIGEGREIKTRKKRPKNIKTTNIVTNIHLTSGQTPQTNKEERKEVYVVIPEIINGREYVISIRSDKTKNTIEREASRKVTGKNKPLFLTSSGRKKTPPTNKTKINPQNELIETNNINHYTNTIINLDDTVDTNLNVQLQSTPVNKPKNDAEELIKYLSTLETSVDTDITIQNYIISKGFNETMRKIILLQILNTGLPKSNQFGQWIKEINKNITLLSNVSVDIPEIYYHFYYEYFLFHLIHNKYPYNSFLFFGQKIKDVKYKVTYIEFVKKMIEEGKLQEKLKELLILNGKIIFDEKIIGVQFIPTTYNILIIQLILHNIIASCCKVGFINIENVVHSNNIFDKIQIESNVVNPLTIIIKKLFQSSMNIDHAKFFEVIMKIYDYLYNSFFYEKETNIQIN